MIGPALSCAARNPKLLGIPFFAIYRRILLSFLAWAELGTWKLGGSGGRRRYALALSSSSAPPYGAENEGVKCREFRATSTQKCLNWSQKRESGKVNPKREKTGEKFPFFTLNGAVRAAV